MARNALISIDMANVCKTKRFVSHPNVVDRHVIVYGAAKGIYGGVETD